MQQVRQSCMGLRYGACAGALALLALMGLGVAVGAARPYLEMLDPAGDDHGRRQSWGEQRPHETALEGEKHQQRQGKTDRGHPGVECAPGRGRPPAAGPDEIGNRDPRQEDPERQGCPDVGIHQRPHGDPEPVSDRGKRRSQ